MFQFWSLNKWSITFEGNGVKDIILLAAYVSDYCTYFLLFNVCYIY